jgi:CubicO group peptidase (beta-lactamase class C family)
MRSKLWLAVGLSVLCTTVHGQTNKPLVRSRFNALDKNADGKITADETPRRALLRFLDKNGDKALSIEEFAKAFELATDRRSDQASESWTAAEFVHEIPADAPLTRESILEAAEYSASLKGISFYVLLDGQLIYADYPNGGGESRAHELASGTKSFTGVMAAVAIDEGLISLDERVCDTLTEWQSDSQKSKITVEQLLHLTSGISPGSETSSRVPSFASAIANPLLTEPGETFNYGPAHFQCFGEFLRRKLAAKNVEDSPVKYLKRKVLEPIGLKINVWRKDEDGFEHLPSGAALTATQWATFGELIRLNGQWEGEQIVSPEQLDECFVGSNANPAYGLTFWLNRQVSPRMRRAIPQLRRTTDDMKKSDSIPSDLVYAAGAGNQRLFISRSAKLVVVRQAEGIVDAMSGRRTSYSDKKFLELLLKKK